MIVDFVNQLIGRIDQTKANLREDAIESALDASALIKSRVQQSGVNSVGQSFEDYTPDYADTRRNEGYQTNYVDFTRTGKMWASFGPTEIQESDGEVAVTLAFNNPSDQTKANGQFAKRGNIAAISQEEEQIILQAFAEKQLARLNQ